VTCALETIAPFASTMTPPNCPVRSDPNSILWTKYCSPIPVTGPSAPETSVEGGGSKLAAMGVATKVFHFVLLRKKHFPLQKIDRHVHFRKREIGAAFFANGAPECMNTNERCRTRRAGSPRAAAERDCPSAPSTGFTFSPATSAERMLAPTGNCTFKMAEPDFLMVSFISVSDLPSVVTSVVTTARVSVFADEHAACSDRDRRTAVVTTLVTTEGRSLTEIKLTIKNQAQPFLKVQLPVGASILSAEVAGEKK